MYRIRKNRVNLQTNNPDTSENMKVNVMIITITILYVLLVAPNSLYSSIYGFNSLNDPIAILFYCLSLLNPAVNFYALFISGSLFREAVMKWLREKLSCKSSKWQGHRSSEGQSHESSEVEGQGHLSRSVSTTMSTENSPRLSAM